MSSDREIEARQLINKAIEDGTEFYLSPKGVLYYRHDPFVPEWNAHLGGWMFEYREEIVNIVDKHGEDVKAE